MRHATSADLVIAGYGSDAAAGDFKADGVRIVGQREDLAELYNQARVFVVPARYAAGIPYKAHEAASFGVPLVVSSLIAEQLSWEDEEECLVADNPAAFAEACCRLYGDPLLWSKIRSSALLRVTSDLNGAVFRNAISSLLGEVVGHRPGSGLS